MLALSIKEWVQTEFSNGEIETPASVGHTEQYFFSHDHNFVKYIDEQGVAESPWYLGNAVIGICVVEILSANAEDWVWTIEEGDVQHLFLQTGFECPSVAAVCRVFEYPDLWIIPL